MCSPSRAQHEHALLVSPLFRRSAHVVVDFCHFFVVLLPRTLHFGFSVQICILFSLLRLDLRRVFLLNFEKSGHARNFASLCPPITQSSILGSALALSHPLVWERALDSSSTSGFAMDHDRQGMRPHTVTATVTATNERRDILNVSKIACMIPVVLFQQQTIASTASTAQMKVQLVDQTRWQRDQLSTLRAQRQRRAIAGYTIRP